MDDDDLIYMLRHSHLSANSLRDLEREIVDREILKNARTQHQRVQDAAITASINYELEEENRRLEELAKQEQRRVRLAEQRIKEQAEFERLKAVPTPTPPPPPPPPPAQVPKSPNTKSIGTQTPPPPPQNVAAAIPPPPSVQPPPQPPAPTTPAPLFAPAKPNLFSQPAVPQTQPAVTNLENAQTTREPQSSTSHINPDAARYEEIHKELKNMRNRVAELGKQNQGFRDKAGELRRALRTKVGQIKAVKVAGANKDQITAIMAIMKSAQEYGGPQYDPTPLYVRPPPPVAGQPNTLPILFIYIMNIFTKTILTQFITEAGIKPAAADPIGTVTVNILARNGWRGASLIDILIAKFRITCPVLFGFRGNESTEQGRKRLGWWKTDGEYVTEDIHNDRMTGLGAGFAAISLRDFSKAASMRNPFPPTKYWQAMAMIVSTPKEEVCNTQFLVLKAMIDGYEMKFLGFYGNAARAALRVAVVEFPKRAGERNSAVNALAFLEGKILDELGLRLS